MRARQGQVILFLLFVLVVLILLTLLNVDTFVSVRAKNRLQNAGDAAAMAAAHKQGQLINEIGRLNLRHLSLACQSTNGLTQSQMRARRQEMDDLVLEQRRKALIEPVEALRLANQAAKKNGMGTRDDFAWILRDHVKTVRTVYAGGGQSGDPFPESYSGAWTEYAARIESVIGEGLATGPDNIEFYYGLGGHLLLRADFYQAIAGREWCWFKDNARGLLTSYSSYHDWAPLPARRENSMENSEIFSLHVSARKVALTQIFTAEQIEALLERYADTAVKNVDVGETFLADPEQVWFFFDTSRWRQWFVGLRLVDEEEGDDFPLAGEIKPEYNVRGCASVCRCETEVSAVAVDATSDFTWSAAAKPFGTLENLEGELGPVTGLAHFVVPCLTDVRLVPLDSVGGQSLGTANAGWVDHIRHHLGDYLLNGPRANGCFYCLQLETWERGAFRREGERWLKYNAGSCVRYHGGTRGGHGGTSHGH